MDLNTYEGSFVFFYDILTELAKSKILQTIVEVYLILNQAECEEAFGEDIYFETKNCTEKKLVEYSILASE